jgi:hypothetical protein
MTDPKLDEQNDTAESLFKKPQQSAPTISEYAREQWAIIANLQRLKAERLAREANI